MTNFALAADVKCDHAQSVIDSAQAKKFGLSCASTDRMSRISRASALAWLDRQEEFEKLAEDTQYKITCVARDLERVIGLTNWTCPPEIEIEACDSSVDCSRITAEVLGDVECSTDEVILDTVVGEGYQIPPTGYSESSIYSLGILEKLDDRYYTKAEMARKISQSTNTFVIGHPGYTAADVVNVPLTEPSGAKPGDILIETYDNAMLFWRRGQTVWTLESRHDYPRGVSSRVITSSSQWLPTDDRIVINANASDVTYILPASPAADTVVKIMASDLTNSAQIDPNGKQINGENSSYLLFNTFATVEFHFVESLDMWIANG